MQNLNFLETEHLDLLFRGKNKNYGAYALRKDYPVRAKQALAITALSILLIYGVQFVLPSSGIKPLIDAPTYEGEAMQIISCEFETRTALLPVAAPQINEVIQDNIPTVIAKNDVIREVVTDKPSDPIPSSVNATGLTTNSNPSLAGSGGVGASTISKNPTGPTGPSAPATINKTAIPTPDPTPLEYAEVLPEFPGGENAMLAYLKSKMSYPKMAADNGIEGKVYVQFVVNTKGGISNVKVLNGLGMGCDKEATRVIRSMPKWKPASNDGNPVNFSFVLPIEFEL